MVQLFCNTDEQGNITESYYGQNILANDSYTFFFLVDVETALNIANYRVEVSGFTTTLVLKEI